MSKIGILGGSFNPPHLAHLEMAVSASEQYGLDVVYLMPNHHPPHKSEIEFVSDEHRERMVRLLIRGKNKKRLAFSDLELKRDEISYTYLTLEILHADHPDDDLYFIIGADSLRDFPKWRNPERICGLANILVAPRGELRGEEFLNMLYEMSDRFDGNFLMLDVGRQYEDVSSSGIREALEKSEVDVAVPKKILRYIELHGLYGAIPLVYEGATDEEIRKCLKVTLKPNRYVHTIGVAETAKKLGKIHGEKSDKELAKKAYTAGLLHDCAKYYTEREQTRLCSQYGIELTETELENPALIHGKLGAYLAEHRYGIRDEEILESIRVHTVGKPAMTKLEKIIYIADYIEPNRQIPDALHPLDTLREIAGRDLDQAVRLILENTISYLSKTGAIIDDMSKKTLKYYSERKEK